MKLLMRLDDLGYSRGVNYGMKEVISKIDTANIGLMVNMEYAHHGVNLVKNYLNLCLGLHINLCIGKPVSKLSNIPSLIDPETSHFYSSNTINNREFDTMNLDECLIEVKNQLRKFYLLAGRLPDYIDVHAIETDTAFEATKIVANEFNLFIGEPIYDNWENDTKIKKAKAASMDKNIEYNPYDYVFNDKSSLGKVDIGMLVFHPGYLDKFIFDHSSFNTVRMIELDFLISNKFSEWLQQREIELVNFKNYQI